MRNVPIVEAPDQVERIVALVLDIEGQLRGAIAGETKSLSRCGEYWPHPTLSSGWPSYLLLASELEIEYPGRFSVGLTDRVAERVLGTLQTDELSMGLFAGFPGMMWCLLAYSDLLREETRESLADSQVFVDLIEAVQRQRWRAEHDLMRGVVGLGALFLVAPAVTLRREGVAAVCSELVRLARIDGEGARWITPSSYLPEEMRVRFPNGQLNLGLAHGHAGVVAFLARAVEILPENPVVRELLARAVEFLLGKANTGGPLFCFSCRMSEIHAEPGRLAWCHGDLGISLALARAAEVLEVPEWRDFAAGLVLRTACIDVDASGVQDASICHGSAGLAHLFARAYQATGVAEAADASRRWASDALSRRGDAESIGGFQTLEIMGGRQRWLPDGGFLNGSCGIALALLSLVRCSEARWDRLLLTDV